MALRSRWHITAFAVALAVLFLLTFQVAGMVLRGARTADADAVPLPSFPVDGQGTILVQDPSKPDLAVLRLANTECAAASRTSHLTVTVVNGGSGRTGGFRLYADLDVENTATHARASHESWVYVPDLAPGDEVVLDLPYEYPTVPLDHSVVPDVGVDQAPVLPGSYGLRVALDQPRGLGPVLGPEGVLAESDESNNVATTTASGVPGGAC